MNIFVLDSDPKLAATWHCDKHVVKMILETAQILCTTLHLQEIEAPYRKTHANHPCSIWARETKENFDWLVELGLGLCAEYTNRYGKVHKSEKVIKQCQNQRDNLNFANKGLTPFAQAMPDDCKSDDPVKAYRKYYIEHKKDILNWKMNRPYWAEEG